MMFRFASAIIGATVFLQPMLALAQSASSSSSVPSDAEFAAVITGPADVAVGRTVVLNASLSRTLGAPEVEYQWFIGDSRQPISRNVEAVYTPETPGPITFRLVIRATIDGELNVSDAYFTITAYARKIALIADASVPPDKIELHKQVAREMNIYLPTVQPPATTVSVGTEAGIFDALSENIDALAGAEAVVIWSDSISGLQALMRVVQAEPDLLAGVHNQTIILVSERGLQTLARTARGPFSVLRPQQILLTRKEALNPLFSTASVDEFQTDAERRDIDLFVLDASTAGVRPWNLLSTLVNAMLTRGISSDAVLLLLSLPVIAMILAFLKQIVGVTTFGLYTPSIVALSFLALGWPVGVLLLLCIVFTGYATRSLMRRWRLLYIPKVAIILTVVSITLLIIMGAAAYLGVTFSRDTIFILLIMSTLAESFLNLKTEEGWYAAMWGIGETIVASLLCVWIVQWPFLQSILLAYPELVLLTLFVNVFLGRWTGLRLMEYFRFREVFRHLQEE